MALPRLSHTKAIATVFAATTAQAGYPATNAGNESLGRPWYSTTTGANDFTITFPAPVVIASWCLHDVNFSGVPARRSADGVVFTALGNFVSYPDENGRRRGRIAVGGAAVKSLQLQIPNGASLDGLTFHRIGASYPWTAELSLPHGVNYGYRVRTTRPQAEQSLVNGLTAVARTGLDIDRIEMTFERKFSSSLRELITRPSAATCWFETMNAEYPEQAWPVKLRDRDIEEVYFKVHKAQRTIALGEVVGSSG